MKQTAFTVMMTEILQQVSAKATAINGVDGHTLAQALHT